MKFDLTEIEDVRAVFGDEGAEMVKDMYYVLGEIDRVLKDDDGNVAMELTEEGAADPYVRIHEFAHYYHCRLFPNLSELCLPYRAEAVAFLAEKMLEDERHLPPDWVEARIQHWAEVLGGCKNLLPLLDVVDAASGLTYMSMRDKVEMILAGGLG